MSINHSTKCVLFFLIGFALLSNGSKLFAEIDYVTRVADSEAQSHREDFSFAWADVLNSSLRDIPAGTNPTTRDGVRVLLSDETLKQASKKQADIKLASAKLTSKADPAKPDLTPQQSQLHQQIGRCLAMYYRLPVDTEKWRPWTIMHGLLSYGRQSRVTNHGQLFYALDHLCHNQIGHDTQMMYLSGNSLGVSVGPGVQGHEGQFLAMLAQSDVPVTQVIQIKGRRFTVEDLIEFEKLGCRQNTELTFKLIGLSHYLNSDDIWRNSNGQGWNIERLIHEELKQPINGAACGGTHRLMGLSYAIKQQTDSGQSLRGEWARAQNFIEQYQDYAMSYQNNDGSFSTNWFVTLEADSDIKKRLYSTGHFVEWLSLSLPQEKLRDPRLTKAVSYLTNLMLTAPAMDLEIGPRGHAIHALRIYEERAFGVVSDVEQISRSDMAIVDKALLQQKRMKPEFISNGGTAAQNISYPGAGPLRGRRLFRNR